MPFANAIPCPTSLRYNSIMEVVRSLEEKPENAKKAYVDEFANAAVGVGEAAGIKVTRDAAEKYARSLAPEKPTEMSQLYPLVKAYSALGEPGKNLVTPAEIAKAINDGTLLKEIDRKLMPRLIEDYVGGTDPNKKAEVVSEIKKIAESDPDGVANAFENAIKEAKDWPQGDKLTDLGRFAMPFILRKITDPTRLDYPREYDVELPNFIWDIGMRDSFRDSGVPKQLAEKFIKIINKDGTILEGVLREGLKTEGFAADKINDAITKLNAKKEMNSKIKSRFPDGIRDSFVEAVAEPAVERQITNARNLANSAIEGKGSIADAEKALKQIEPETYDQGAKVEQISESLKNLAKESMRRLADYRLEEIDLKLGEGSLDQLIKRINDIDTSVRSENFEGLPETAKVDIMTKMIDKKFDVVRYFIDNGETAGLRKALIDIERGIKDEQGIYRLLRGKAAATATYKTKEELMERIDKLEGVKETATTLPAEETIAPPPAPTEKAPAVTPPAAPTPSAEAPKPVQPAPPAAPAPAPAPAEAQKAAPPTEKVAEEIPAPAAKVPTIAKPSDQLLKNIQGRKLLADVDIKAIENIQGAQEAQRQLEEKVAYYIYEERIKINYDPTRLEQFKQKFGITDQNNKYTNNEIKDKDADWALAERIIAEAKVDTSDLSDRNKAGLKKRMNEEIVKPQDADKKIADWKKTEEFSKPEYQLSDLTKLRKSLWDMPLRFLLISGISFALLSPLNKQAIQYQGAADKAQKQVESSSMQPAEKTKVKEAVQKGEINAYAFNDKDVKAALSRGATEKEIKDMIASKEQKAGFGKGTVTDYVLNGLVMTGCEDMNGECKESCYINQTVSKTYDCFEKVCCS
jgi:hypothetical protein